MNHASFVSRAYAAVTSARLTLLVTACLVAASPFRVMAQSAGGVVLDAATQQPISGALVQIVAADSTVLSGTFTDSAGRFRLPEGCGTPTHFVYASRMGYRPARIIARALSEDCEAWRIELALDPVILPALGVEAAATRLGNDGFDARRRAGFGTFITRSTIEDRYRTMTLVSELFAQSPGVVRVQVSANDYSVFFLRAALSTTEPCPATGYIDGLPYGRELPRLPLQDIEAIEIYRGPSQIPPQYGGATALCGVILIWTRTGPTR